MKNPAAIGRRLFRLAAVLLFVQLAWPAQADERFLLIFNTSAAMKKRVPAVTTLITNLYATTFGGNVHGGDEVGVWTFDEKLHKGEFPLSEWLADDREQNAVNLVDFIRKQKFTGNTSLAVLQPALDRVITNSDRLTLVIVCDGTGEIHWTPYNDGINETLHRTQAERKTARQPVVLVLRTEKGKFIGSAISFPPSDLNFPAFPTPPPPKRAPVKIITTPAPVVTKPVITAPPLVIVGTHVGTNIDELVKTLETSNSNKPVAAKPETAVPVRQPVNPPTNSPVPTEATKPATPTTVSATTPSPVLTNHAAAAVVLPLTNAPASLTTAAPVSPATPPAPPQLGAVTAGTATPAAAPDATEKGYRILVPIAAGILGLSLILSVVAILRSRQPRGSLITDSMNTPKGPLDPK